MIPANEVFSQMAESMGLILTDKSPHLALVRYAAQYLSEATQGWSGRFWVWPNGNWEIWLRGNHPQVMLQVSVYLYFKGGAPVWKLRMYSPILPDDISVDTNSLNMAQLALLNLPWALNEEQPTQGPFAVLSPNPS